MIRDAWLCSHGVWLPKSLRCNHAAPWKGVAIVLNAVQVYSFRRTRDAQRFFAALDKRKCALVQVFPIRKGVVRYV